MDYGIELDLRHRYVATNGIDLHVVEAGPEDGPLALLLHGFPEFWWGWRRQLPALAQAGWRVWAPDQRGYNLSDKPRGLAAYTLDILAADIRGLIEVSGHNKVVLVGHDWGGMVAWWIALRHPHLLHQLVIMNAPHPHAMRHHLLHSPRQRLRSTYAAFFQLPLLPERLMTAADSWATAQLMQTSSGPGVFSKDEMDVYRQAWQRPRAMHCMLNWYRALRQSPRVGMTPANVSVPTLIIWGAKDVALGPALPRLSLSLCADGRLSFLEEASHWVQHEEPARVNDLLLDFLTNPQTKL